MEQVVVVLELGERELAEFPEADIAGLKLLVGAGQLCRRVPVEKVALTSDVLLTRTTIWSLRSLPPAQSP